MTLSETDYLRQAIEKILFVLMVLVIILLVVFFSMTTIYFLKQEFEKEINYTESKVVPVFSKSNFVSNILESELSIFLSTETKAQELETLNDEEIKFEIKEILDIKYEIPLQYEAKTLENGKVEIGNAKISNYSKLELNLEELSKPLFSKLNPNTKFLIFHTHATESYSVESPFVDNYRSNNPEFNMISIGKSLVEQLEARGFSCLQDTILHDYPNYNGSYKHSLDTITKYLKTKEFDFVMDIHRDAISSDLTYGPTCEINGEKAAQLMFVIGTNASGLEHDDWMNNLKLAIMLQNRANEMYPGLFKPMIVRNSRYNQHLGSAACIIEVGATGNTLEQCLNSMKYLAKVIEEM